MTGNLLSIEDENVFAEVYAILSLMGNDYINKIPKKMYSIFENKKSKTYFPKYNSLEELEIPNVRRETLGIISVLMYKYWCDTEEEKAELHNLLEENGKKNKSIQSSFKTLQTENIFINANTQQSLIIQKKDNIFIKLLNKIKKFLRLK